MENFYFFVIRNIKTDIIEHSVAMTSEDDVKSFDQVGNQMIKVSRSMDLHLGERWNNGNPDFSSKALREKRVELLKETDWMSSNDRVMSDAERQYRQDLRDIPNQPGFPNNVVWPTKPQGET